MVVAFTLAGFCECSLVSADTIYLKSGEKIKGKVVQQKDNFVTVERPDGSPIVLSINELQAVESAEPAEEEVLSNFQAIQEHYGIKYDLTPLAPKFETSDLINAVTNLNIEIDYNIEGVVVLNTVEKDIARIVRTAPYKKNDLLVEDSKYVLFLSPDVARTPDQIIRILRGEKRKTKEQVDKERIAMIQRGEIAKVFNSDEQSTEARDKIASGIVKSSNNFLQFMNDLMEGKFRKKNAIEVEDYYLPYSKLFVSAAKPISQSAYENGEIPASGPFIQRKYYPNGVLAAEYSYQDGVLNGKSKEYNELGDLKAELNYANNQLNGTLLVYYDSGKVFKEINYINGKENGDYREYYENGKLHIEMKLKDGERDEYFKEYYESGNLKYIENYLNGKVNGLVQEYNEDGSVINEAHFQDGVQIDPVKN